TQAQHDVRTERREALEDVLPRTPRDLAAMLPLMSGLERLKEAMRTLNEHGHCADHVYLRGLMREYEAQCKEIILHCERCEGGKGEVPHHLPLHHSTDIAPLLAAYFATYTPATLCSADVLEA